MDSFWRRNLIPSIATATILGCGIVVIWFLLLTAAWAVFVAPRHPLGIASHPLGVQAAVTVALLSPALLSAAPLYFLDHPTDGVVQYIAFLAQHFWFSFFILGVVSIPLGIVVFVRHRRFGDRAALIWAVYVMLMGVPGAIGYWLHRRWPPTERCSRCGADAPRDRDACLRCGAAFPLPSPKGVEMLDKTSTPSNEREALSC